MAGWYKFNTTSKYMICKEYGYNRLCAAQDNTAVTSLMKDQMGAATQHHDPHTTAYIYMHALNQSEVLTHLLKGFSVFYYFLHCRIILKTSKL